MTLGEFRELTKDYRDDLELIIDTWNEDCNLKEIIVIGNTIYLRDE